ncbi:hypothetical protein Tco_1170773 [Tanacetum coccineum]
MLNHPRSQNQLVLLKILLTQSKSTGDDLGNTDEQPNVEAASKQDWFKKPARPPTLDPETQENQLMMDRHRIGSMI